MPSRLNPGKDLTVLSAFAFLIAVFCLPAYVYSNEHGHWKSYTIVDGLAGGNVHSIIEDKRGNLWIATDGDGVSRYDGSGFRNFTAKDGLPNNFIYAILEDKKGNLWFASWGAGVCQYDGKAFGKILNLKDGLASNFVTAIFEDKAGNLWFGTVKDKKDNSVGGVSKYNGMKFENFTTEDGLPENDVRSILEDSKGNLWFGTMGGSVCKYDGKSFQPFSLAHDRVNSILEDSQGNLWFGTWDGLYRYDGKKFQKITAKNSGLVYNEVDAILKDSKGNLWFGAHSGVSKYDGRSFQNFTTSDGLVGDDIKSIIEDREGNLWFGTWGHGISMYDDKIQHYLEDKNIKYALEARNGDLWFATQGGGVFRYDGKAFQNFTVKDGLTTNEIYTILETKNGYLWFSGLGGITKYDGKVGATGQSPFQTIKDKDIESKNNPPEPIFEDSKGNLWINVLDQGHENTIKIGRYDGKNFHYFPIAGNIEIPGAENKIALEDREGNIWFATESSGVYRYRYKYDHGSLEHFTLDDGLAGDRISSIAEDKAGNIWFGVRGNDKPGAKGIGGLSMYTYNGKRFRTYSTKDGLGSDSVTSILKDGNGNLWFRTWHGGVSKYDGKSFRTFTMKDGLASNTIRSMLEDNKGNLWFGSQSAGISQYDGQSFQTLTTEDGLINNSAFVILADRKGNLWIRYAVPGLTKYTPSKGVLPKVEISQVVADKTYKIYKATNEVKLPHHATHIVFEYKGISFKTKFDNIRYLFKLEGHDKIWSASTKERKAEYDKLKPGTYVFKVKAIDRDLNYSEPSASIKLVILPPPSPPFYMTARFVIPAVIVILAFASVSFISFYSQRKIAAELREYLRQKEEVEKQRMTKELQDAHDMQMRLMPEAAPQIPGFDIFGICKPANEVGGDFFDYLWLGEGNDRLAIALADVSGKRMKAAMTAVMANGMLHAEAKLWGYSVKQLLSELNKDLCARTERRDFVAFCLAVVNIKERTLQFSNAGQWYPLIKRGEEAIIIDQTGLVLGMIENTDYEEMVVALVEEDAVIFYTDGIVEAMNQADEMYGFDRLKDLVRKSDPRLSACQLVEEILRDINKFVGETKSYDDMTIVVLKVSERKGGAIDGEKEESREE